ncbi:MAG: CBS domain-containing protein [Bdellovibrionia bacterium]
MIRTIIGEHMVRFPHTVESKITVREAYYLMEEWRIRHLPIVDDHVLIGIVSERDLRQHFPTSGETKLFDVMTKTPYCVRIGTSLESVVEVMERKKIGSAIVVSANHDVLGIFTTTDALKILRRKLTENPSGKYINLDEDTFEQWDQIN